jgi:hypothetical protein
MRSKMRSTFITMMVGVVLADGAALAEGPRGLAVETPQVALPRGPQALSWTEDVTVGDGTGELVRTRDGLLFEPYAVMRRPEGLSRLTGLYTFPARTLERPVDTLRPLLQAKSALGMDIEVDVRVRTATGWSEWSTTTSGQPVRLLQAGTVVQVRLALMADEHGRGPLVQGLTVEGTLEGGSTQTSFRTLAALSYRVFATREGLVGGTTANGHVIRSSDRFVALPSRRALASNGGSEYQVKVCYAKTGKCATTSVWDVGPWNTKDDYWNPSAMRQMWRSLPQGKPEAQAASRASTEASMSSGVGPPIPLASTSPMGRSGQTWG